MKKKNIKLKKLIISIFIFAFAAALVVYAIINLNKGPEKWTGLHSGFVSASTQHKALVVSEEIVFKTLNQGQISNAETEGKRVKKGQVIATLITSENTVPSEKDEVTSETIKENENPVTSDEKSADKESIKKDTVKLYQELNDTLKKQNNSKAKNIKRELLYKLDYLQKIDNLNQKSIDNYNVFEKFVGSNLAESNQEFNIIATESGIVSYYIDKFHGKLNFENRYNIDYDNVFSNPPIPENVLGKNLQKGDAALKIVYNLKWHLMCKCSLDDLDTFKQDKVLKLQIGGNTFDGTVVDKFMAKNTGIVVFEINEASDYMINSRLLDVTIVKDEMSGVVIPRNAIFTENEVKGVYIKGVSGEKIFRPIEIIGQNDEGFIVTESSYTLTDEAGTIKTIDTVTSKDSVLLNGSE